MLVNMDLLKYFFLMNWNDFVLEEEIEIIFGDIFSLISWNKSKVIGRLVKKIVLRKWVVWNDL